MDTNSYYAHQSPQQRSSSDPFHKHAPSDQFAPPATSHNKNFQSTTDNPFYRRTSVAEYASLPESAAKIPALKPEEPETGMRQRRSVADPIMSEEAEDIHMKSEHEHDDSDDWQPEPAVSKPRRGRKPKQEVEEDVGPVKAEGDIEVKTKFPVARIKRIMQADEDVGKVAQVTPVAVSKALELFMISIIASAASEARGRGQKRVGAAHLKNTILKETKFDFLTDIANRIPDASAKSGSGDESKGKTKGRRKRKDED